MQLSEKVAKFLIEESQKLHGKFYIGNKISPLSKEPMSPSLKFLNSHTLRKVSLRVNRSLIAWSEGKYNLCYTENVPTPMEVLEMQSLGKRIVSIPKETISNKTPYEFVIHDLEHADRFFHDPLLHSTQVQFFNNLKSWIKAELFSELMRDDVFETKFNYLISDMNSHPAHMSQYLKHIIQETVSTKNIRLPGNLWSHILVDR